MLRIVFLFFICQFAIAQTWSNFSYFGDNEKTNFDVDENSAKINSEILTLWVRLRPKESSNLFYATLDKLNVRCTDFQYAVSTRKSIDKDGKVLREIYDLPESGLKWVSSGERSIPRRIGLKYCNTLNQVQKSTVSDENWLSLGQNENSEFTYYVNPTKNKISGDELSYLGKVVYASEQKNTAGKLYKFVVNETVVNCRNSTYAVVKSEVFNSINIMIDSNSVSKEFADFKPMNSSSFVGRIREKYCDPSLLSPQDKKEVVRQQANNKSPNLVMAIDGDAEKCEKLGFKKTTPPFDRCVKQLSETK